jgi:hypothetical protein
LYCSRNPAKGTNEQHPARHSLSRSAVLGYCFVRSRIRRFRFAVFGKQLGATAPSTQNILYAVRRCNPGGLAGPSRPTDDAPTTNFQQPAQRSRPYLPFGSRVKRRRGQNHKGQNRRGPKRSAARALRACALGIIGTEAQLRPRRQERINALPRPPTSRHDQQGQERRGFAVWRNPYGRQLRPTIESVTGRRASSFWVEDEREPGVRMVRTTERPCSQGPSLLHEVETWDARSIWRLATG